MTWWIITLDSSNYIFHNWNNTSLHIKCYGQLGEFLTVHSNFSVCDIKSCTKFNKCVSIFKSEKYQASCFLCKLLCPKHSVYYQNEKWQHFVICSNWYCTLQDDSWKGPQVPYKEVTMLSYFISASLCKAIIT